MTNGPGADPAFFDVLRRRHMTRAFTDELVAPERVEQIVDAAFRGPSAGNSQGMHLLVLTGDDVTAYWDTTLSPDRRAQFPWPGLLAAPVLVVPYVEPHRYVDRYSETDKASTGLGDDAEAWTVPYWWVDGGAAVENILLTAEALELGVCFFGQFRHEPAVRARFGVPEGFRALGTLALGHPDSSADRPSLSAQRGRRSADETVHRSRW